jgi:hypothetical protein
LKYGATPGSAVTRESSLNQVLSYLKLSEREILRHSGKVKVSHDDAITKAELEYDRFAGARVASISVEQHFEDGRPRRAFVRRLSSTQLTRATQS